MNQHSDSTIRYYDDHADQYVQDTVGVEMQSLYDPFLELISPGGKILDAGCGSGRDSKTFKDRGFVVTAFDASEKMANHASRLLEQPVSVVRLEDVAFTSEFDGIWACASLLHVPRHELDDVLVRLIRALKPNGVCFVSFKEGEGECQDGGRYFNDLQIESLERLLVGHSEIEVVRLWTTSDLRPDQQQVRWVNGIVRRIA